MAAAVVAVGLGAAWAYRPTVELSGPLVDAVPPDPGANAGGPASREGPSTDDIVSDVRETTTAWSGNTIYSVSMHTHGSFSEGDATMAWHTEQAIANDLDVLWWTDHDTFFVPDGVQDVDGFDFESGSLLATIPAWPSTEGQTYRWSQWDEGDAPEIASFDATIAAARAGGYGGRISATAAADGVEQPATWYIDCNPKLNFRSLMSGVDLSFAVRPVIPSPNAEFRLVVPLSGTRAGASTPNGTDWKRIIFYHGRTTHPTLSDDGTTAFVPIVAARGAWVRVDANLSDIAEAAWGPSAADLHAELVEVQVLVSAGETGTYDVDNLQWTSAIVGDDLRVEQDAYLAALGGSPVQLTGIEVSPIDEGHFNAYGSDIPILPYSASDTWDAASVVDYVHTFGGLVSYNHMFGVQTTQDDATTRSDNIADRVAVLEASSAWGIDLLEVGYRQRGGLIDDFLQVWDQLSMANVFVTGVGATDLHNTSDYATYQNNFANFIPVASFSEAALMERLRSGAIWFGDNTLFPGGHVTLTLDCPRADAHMGQVVVGRTGRIGVVFTSNYVGLGWKVRWVENGVVTATSNTNRRGVYSASRLVPTGSGNVVRVEILTNTSFPVAYTNPIYFVATDPGTIPDDRLP